MSSPKNIQDELKSLESSLSFNNNIPFSVPEGYFESLPAAILAKIKSSDASVNAELDELSPLLAGIPKVTPYSVPFSYFEGNIESSGSVNKEPDSAVLSYIGKELPYVVPYDYFNFLPEQILAKVASPKARVLPFFAKAWMRFAAAAVVAGALILAGLQFFETKSEESDLAATKTETVQDQVAQTIQPVIKEIKEASTEELEDFIKTIEVTAAAPEVKSSDKEAEELLKDVSASEIESFLSSIPTDEGLLITN